MEAQLQTPAPAPEQGPGRYDHLFEDAKQDGHGRLVYEPIVPEQSRVPEPRPDYAADVRKRTANREAMQAIEAGNVSPATKRALGNLSALFVDRSKK